MKQGGQMNAIENRETIITREIESIVRQIVNKYHPEKIILFGSAARGDFEKANDLDFLFVKEAAFGLAICMFMIFEPNGLAYRWWQSKNYFNLWPFSY